MNMQKVIKELRRRSKNTILPGYSCWVVQTVLGDDKGKLYCRLFSPDDTVYWVLSDHGKEYDVYTDEEVQPLRETMVLLFGEYLANN